MRTRLAAAMPAWSETGPADVGQVLVEVLAHVADQLSYFQDAVATEAYLGTARRRVSIRRHARLLDYALHEGCNARVWAQVRVAAPVRLAAGTRLVTRIEPPTAVVLDDIGLEAAVAAGATVFETMHDVDLVPGYDHIALHDWGLPGYQLAPGATTAALVGDLPGVQPGTVLILESAALSADRRRRPASALARAADRRRTRRPGPADAGSGRRRAGHGPHDRHLGCGRRAAVRADRLGARRAGRRRPGQPRAGRSRPHARARGAPDAGLGRRRPDLPPPPPSSGPDLVGAGSAPTRPSVPRRDLARQDVRAAVPAVVRLESSEGPSEPPQRVVRPPGPARQRSPQLRRRRRDGRRRHGAAPLRRRCPRPPGSGRRSPERHLPGGQRHRREHRRATRWRRWPLRARIEPRWPRR